MSHLQKELKEADSKHQRSHRRCYNCDDSTDFSEYVAKEPDDSDTRLISLDRGGAITIEYEPPETDPWPDDDGPSGPQAA